MVANAKPDAVSAELEEQEPGDLVRKHAEE